MIPNLIPGTKYAIHMRRPSPDGGTADWIGSVTSTGEIHTFWGKTGASLQTAGKKGTMADLWKIIDEKKNQGVKSYAEVDDYDASSGWSSQRGTSGSSTTAKPKPPKPLGPPVNLVKKVPVDAIDQTPAAAVTPLAWDF